MNVVDLSVVVCEFDLDGITEAHSELFDKAFSESCGGVFVYVLFNFGDFNAAIANTGTVASQLSQHIVKYTKAFSVAVDIICKSSMFDEILEDKVATDVERYHVPSESVKVYSYFNTPLSTYKGNFDVELFEKETS